MSYTKGSNEPTSKNKIYQTKTVSEKNITGGKDLTLTLYLNKLIDQYQIEDIEDFLKKENPSSDILNNAISLLLKKYNLGDGNFYKLLDLLLQAGASPDISINNNSQENSKIPNISEKENITLLMLGIMINDIDLINIVLKYNPNINQCDSFGKNAMLYAVINNHNDSTKIINLLINNKANINSALNIQFSQNQIEFHSVFTLACLQNLPRITKCLIDNYVDVNFIVKPSGNTGLHICAKNENEAMLQILLSCERINPDIRNQEGKKAIELIPDNSKKENILKLFNNYYNNIKNKINMNNNKNHNNENNNFGFQQMNQFNQMNKKNINNINSNGNEQQNNNMISNINNNSNNNMIDNYKLYMNNLNMMNSGSNINNINNENISQKLNNIDNYNFNDSSDFSEEHELKEKQNINKSSKKSHKNNSYLRPYNSIKLLNQRIYNNLLSNSNLNNFNIEIPIELIKKKNNFQEKFNTLNNFISPKINSTPLLNLDITDKCFDLEIKLNELKNQLQEKNKKINEYKKRNEEQEQNISEKTKKLDENNLILENINKSIAENEQNIIKLTENQQELKNKIPKDKLYQESNKDNKSYKELKFQPHQIEDTEMFKILNKDLLDFQKYTTEKIFKKIPLIKNIIEDIKATLNTLTTEYDVKVYGSYANGLCMTWSDLDLVLVNKNANLNNANNANNLNLQENNNENNSENILLEQQNIEPQSDNSSVANTDSTRETFNASNTGELLIYFCYRIKNKPWVKQVSFTENLSIKILRIITVDTYSELNIDVSFDCEKHNGLKCVNLVKSYLEEYTVLKPITIALKAILQSANLHNPNKGGLSSYGLILMVVSYIQSQKENFTLKNEPDLCGKIFYGFLKHYGIFFDFNKYLILTYPINETSVQNTDKESYLNINHFNQEFIILDPLNNKNNVASSSFQFMNLKMAFMIAFMVTKEDCDCGCHYGKAVYENSFNSTEHSYLKRMLNSVRRFQG